MKVSVVVTVKDKSVEVDSLLESLRRQTKPVNEIIVAIGGNRSQGRNAGIKAARNQIIAVTDAGCTADKDWLEKLTQPFTDQSVTAVAGYYRPVVKNKFQAMIAPFVAVMPEKFNPEIYLPSSRSLAFRKGAGLYPENLNYCEDLIFARHLKATGKMIVVKEAMVSWQLVENWRQFFWQIFHYAQGDVQARYLPHLMKISTVWLRYFLFIFLPPLFLLYLLVRPRPQFIADLAVMAGSAFGIIWQR